MFLSFSLLRKICNLRSKKNKHHACNMYVFLCSQNTHFLGVPCIKHLRCPTFVDKAAKPQHMYMSTHVCELEYVCVCRFIFFHMMSKRLVVNLVVCARFFAKPEAVWFQHKTTCVHISYWTSHAWKKQSSPQLCQLLHQSTTRIFTSTRFRQSVFSFWGCHRRFCSNIIRAGSFSAGSMRCWCFSAMHCCLWWRRFCCCHCCDWDWFNLLRCHVWCSQGCRRS